MRSIPLGLTVLRLLLAPVLVWLVYVNGPGLAFSAVILAAFVSDYFDGVLARRLGVATAELRHFDSRADLVFYATAAYHARSSKSHSLRANPTRAKGYNQDV